MARGAVIGLRRHTVDPEADQGGWINLAAVLADDALIEALRFGDPILSEDPLAILLAAWAAGVRNT